jgi:hypothetical protein
MTTTCSRCSDLHTTVQIKTPGELSKALKVIQDNLGDGTLVEAAYWPAGEVRGDFPTFRSIPIEGPWPDYLDYYFECAACGQLYRLVAEVYHGTGGAWSPWKRGE